MPQVLEQSLLLFLVKTEKEENAHAVKNSVFFHAGLQMYQAKPKGFHFNFRPEKQNRNGDSAAFSTRHPRGFPLRVLLPSMRLHHR